MGSLAASMDLAGMRRKALLVGGIALAASAPGLMADPEQFFRSYLVAYLYWAAIPTGCLALLMLHHLVGGEWGIVIRRMLEAGTRTFLLVLLLLAPVLLNLPRLYIWARPDVVAHDKLLQHKAAYLNTGFFLGRTAFYFAAWMLLAFLLNKYSTAQERDKTNGWKGKLQTVSGIGILVYGLTVSFASVDWVMSLDPHWFSTIYGVMFMVGGALTTLSFVVIMLSRLAQAQPMAALLKPSHFHDLGNLMFAFVMLWAYVAFSQFLIIWSGNLPEEIPFYLHRFHGSWGVIAVALLLFHFALPFILLLLRVIKKKAQVLARVAMLMMFMRLVDLIWMVTPSFHGERISLHWLDLTLPVGVGGIWVAYFLSQLSNRPIEPVEAHLIEAPHAAVEGGH
ncbi:MAG: hypothetical protein JJE04_14340 [Acidobacteriia bacterium]|nr:hypothetical protein [Terriglobia bacterium]